jgi:predicted ATPase/DNA-binding SARP family transcriptional activator
MSGCARIDAWKLRVLGPPHLEHDDQPVELNLRKAMALFVYVAVTGQPHSRDALATLLWPDADQREGRASLRRTLHRLSQVIGSELLESDANLIRLHPDAGLWLDCAAFQQHAAIGLASPDAETSETERVRHLAAAAELYTDDFLAGFTLPGSPPFDEWQFFQRENLRGTCARVLDQLTRIHQGREDWDVALGYARRWLALDPLHEPAHRALIELYAQAGQQGAALRQYWECVRVLDAELKAAPEQATTELFEAIRAKRFPPPRPAPSATEVAPVASEDAALAERREPQRPLNTPTDSRLPASATPFIGRERELAELERLLSEPSTRLVTVLGPGGIGKTRLALEVAREMANVNAFQDGVYFVPLAPLKSAAHIAPALAEQIGFRFYPGGEPEQQVLDYLSGKHVLLVFDNFEHLLSDSRRMSDPSTAAHDEVSNGAPFIAALLQAAPNAKIISTSRERLNLSSEAIFTVHSMDFPEEGASQHALEFGAVQLLMQSARLVRPDLEPHSFQPADLARICQLVHGMPLAIILAAGWIEAMSFKEIAEELQRSLDFLQSRAHDLPERQRSMRATFDYSWKQLTEQERRAFMALSVFRGGFTRHAAVAVTGASLWTLRSLVQKSFLALRPDDRYDIHELLRQFGAEHLNASDESERAHDAHAEYFLKFLTQRENDLCDGRQFEALGQIEADLENVRAAWQWALNQQIERVTPQVVESLHLFFRLRRRHVEGAEFFRRAREVMQIGSGQPHRARAHLLAALLFCEAVTESPRPESEADLEESLALARASGDPAEIAFSLAMSAVYRALVKRDYARAIDTFERSLALHRALNAHFHVTVSLYWLSYCHGNLANVEASARCAREGLEVARRHDNRFGVFFNLLQLMMAELCSGNYEVAEQVCREALSVESAMNRHAVLGHAKNRLGLLHLLRGALQEASALTAAGLAEAGLAEARMAGMPVDIAEALAVVSLAAGTSGDYDRGRQFAEESLTRTESFFGRMLGHWAAALAHTGLGQHDAAWRHVHNALALAHGAASSAMMTWPLAVAAILLARRGELERAVELLALADTHPLSPRGWMEHWPLLVESRTKLEAELGAQAYSSAWERGRQLAIEEAVTELLGASSPAA